MYWHETNITEGLDFLIYGRVKHNTVKLRHRLLNIVWYLVALGFACGWAYYLNSLFNG